MKTLLLLLICCCYTMTTYAQSVGNYVIIGATDVKIRTEPSTKSALIGLVQLGDVGKITAVSTKSEFIQGTVSEYESCPEFYWIKVDIENQEGWIFGAFVFEISEGMHIAGENTDGLKLGMAFTSPTGGDMCYGNNFMLVLPYNYKKTRNVKLIDNYTGQSADYRGMPSINFDLNILAAFINDKGKIIITTGGEAPGDYSEISVIELTQNSEGNYDAKERFFSATH